MSSSFLGWSVENLYGFSSPQNRHMPWIIAVLVSLQLSLTDLLCGSKAFSMARMLGSQNEITIFQNRVNCRAQHLPKLVAFERVVQYQLGYTVLPHHLATWISSTSDATKGFYAFLWEGGLTYRLGCERVSSSRKEKHYHMQEQHRWSCYNDGDSTIG